MQLYKFVDPEKLKKESPAYEFAIYCRNSKVVFKFIRTKNSSLSNPTAEFQFYKIEDWENPWYKYHLGDVVNLSLSNIVPAILEPIKIKDMF